MVYDNYGRITSLPSAYSGGGTLATSYFVNDLVRSQTQDGITNTYELDAALRQRERVQTGSKSSTEVYHYAGDSDSPAWIDRGSGWSRNVAGIGGELAAVQDSASGVALQLTNLHGDIVAVSSPDPGSTDLLAIFESDEFGNPKQPDPAKYAWLGGKQRRTELASGVVQMGVRSYVPTIGRFMSSDPVVGGSANAYEYATGDPVNNLDLTGMAAKRRIGIKRRVRVGTGGSGAIATASALTPPYVKKIINAIRSVADMVVPIAWNTCIPRKELSFSRAALLKLFHTTCIPKVRDYIDYPQEIAAAKANGLSWCLLVNGYGIAGNPLSVAVALIVAGAFCGGEDGDRPWAYVKYSRYRIASP